MSSVAADTMAVAVREGLIGSILGPGMCQQRLWAMSVIVHKAFTDIFWVDAAQKTVNGIRATFSEREISWDNEALSKNTVSADRTTHFANRITGKYMVLIRSFNPTKPGQDISEYAGQCVRNPQE